MASAEENLPVQVGDVLAGKYRVERVLGIGGMGVVVAAKHLQLDQLVALKFLLPAALGSDEAVARFLREAKAAVRLKSEHVARVSDVGTLESGAPYMVMEYLDGADLSQIVKATDKLGIPEAVAFVLQASEAIAEAHSIGIIHRDLKPQNLFVTRRVDGRPLIKVLDFGISKSIDTQSGLSLTRTSSIMGSPLYMSPEQMRSTKNVDLRSDIWALGVILYELLTGRVPFEAEAVPELCLKVVQDTPTEPRALRPETSAALNAVVMKCLEKDPSNRFQDVAELAAALEPHADESARGATGRISSTLQVSPRSPMTSVADLSRSNPKVRTGDTAWGATQPLPAEQKKRRTTLLVAGAGAGVAVVALGLFFAIRGATAHDAPTSSEHATQASSGAPVPAVTSARTADPLPVVAASAPTGSSASASASSIVPATAHAPTAAHAPSGKPASTGKHDASTAAPTVTAPPRTFE